MIHTFKIKSQRGSPSYVELISLVRIKRCDEHRRSAPARRCRLRFGLQRDPVPWGLNEHQRFVALQLMSQGHKYGFHVVVVIGVFGRGFEQRHTVRVSKFLCQVCRYLDGTP